MKSFVVQLIYLLPWLCTPLVGQNSPHGEIGIPCTNCHATSSWKEVTVQMSFDHAKTPFVLQGRHKTTECRQCHVTLRFSETPTECFFCHRQDFDSAPAVNHRAEGFSTHCVDCHSETAVSWPESFDHNKTEFPTRGAHEAVDCLRCHTNNHFRGISSQCVSCHLTEYRSAQDPNHATAGFSTDCAMCHRALTWQPATFFPHAAFFPIARGDKHSPGVWTTCRDCHIEGSNYSTFECIDCHHHNKAAVDGTHSGRRGYVYQSSACYRCHPHGESGGG
jgi:hypothetical protein